MATQGDQKQWGLTPPISTALPTDKEKELNDALIEELKAHDNFESPENTEKRRAVLQHLQNVTVAFVREVGRKRGLPQSMIDNSGGLVSTFGSYRLGVYGPGSDIDTCIICPKHVSRDDFFELFIATLEKMSPKGAIDDVVPVQDTHVPIIKLHYTGIDLDVIFVRLNLSVVTQDTDLKDNNVLRGLDEVDLRCINGTRVTDQMLGLVPQTKSFRLALRAVKLWAVRKGVYGAQFGYPGGVAWALMIARICQLYPFACGASIVWKFFYVMGGWQWPRPIMLKAVEEGPLQVRVWNPQIYPGDKRHLMPIITPAYPSMCATHNVSYSTKKVIVQELTRGTGLTGQIQEGKKTWKELFAKDVFFSEGYKYYLAVIASSRTKDAQNKWSSFVQSRVRRLVIGIEQADAGVELARPYPKGFERVHHCSTEANVDAVLQGSMDFVVTDKTATTDENKDMLPEPTMDNAGEKKDLSPSDAMDLTEEGKKVIHSTTWYIGIELMEGSKSLDISYPVAEFKRQILEWPDYVPELHTMRTIHIRNYDLPFDVFGPHETRPVKKAKKGARKDAASATRKRSFAESGMQEITNGRKRQANGTVTPTPAG